jgi:large subunit ribosomal protein L15
MSNELSKLMIHPGSRRDKKRVGRGIGSGRGKTAGRGVKGQLSRAGEGRTPGFEGGQMPLQRRLPKRGFHNSFAEDWDVLNLDAITRLVGVDVVDIEVMAAAGFVSGRRKVKVLGRGELERGLTVKAHAFSAGARAKIEASGGKVEVL